MHALTRTSSNKKTGPIPVSTHTSKSCPPSCVHNGVSCYAQSGPLSIHWRKVTNGERGTDWLSFTQQIKSLPKGQLWRYAQAGDLPGIGDSIDTSALKQLVKANKGRNGFGYTHKPLTPSNLHAVTEANQQGFTINVSTDNTQQAARTVKHHPSLPVVTLLPMDAPNTQSVDGVKVVACPAEKSDRVTCASCGLCADSKRDYVIGFRAHGTQKKKVNLIATVAA